MLIDIMFCCFVSNFLRFLRIIVGSYTYYEEVFTLCFAFLYIVFNLSKGLFNVNYSNPKRKLELNRNMGDMGPPGCFDTIVIPAGLP